MELLNNVWTALSTPNEELINIFAAVLLVVAEAPLTFQLIVTVFKLDYSKKDFIVYVATSSAIALFSTYLVPWPFNIVINYGCTLFLIYFIFKLNILKVIIASVFPSIIFNLLGNLILNPYLTLLDITYEQANTIPIYRIPFAVCMYLIIFAIILLFKHKNIYINIIESLDNKNKFILTLNFIFAFLYLIIQCVLLKNFINILPIGFTFFSFVCLLIYFGLSFYSLGKIISLINTTQKLESAEEYNKTLRILHDNVRGFKHDFDNIVTTIGGYIKTNDMKGLEKYYSQLEEDCARVNNLYILNPEIINNPGIYNLLTTKYNEATEKDIKVNLTFLLDLNELHMKIYEFARILGILLDNAIEAASECENKIINITFRNDSKNSRNIVQIENTYKDKDVDIEEIFNKGVSGKENHTGLGLWEIRQILKKNNNLNLHTTKNDKYFSQQLEIYY